MSLPSWIGRVPSNLGSSQHGKLSADEWRTTCTVILVVSLTRQWGNKPLESRERKMLVNFIDLVVATKLAMMRTLTLDRIDAFHNRMLKYLQGSRELYPVHGLRPNQHISLHLKPMLENFGPTHAWRCYVFERLNSMLQSIHTNSKAGEADLRSVCTVGSSVTGQQEKWKSL